MGTDISLADSKFFIAAEDKERALKAVKEFTKKFAKTQTSLAYIDIDNDILAAETIEEVLDNCSWETKSDDEGNIVSISFYRESQGDEFKIFESIASFVKPGSYLEIHYPGYHEIERWVFNGENLKVIHPKIIWGEPKVTISDVLRSCKSSKFFNVEEAMCENGCMAMPVPKELINQKNSYVLFLVYADAQEFKKVGDQLKCEQL